MAIPLLKTKLYVPPVRPGLVSRPRLVERLNEGLRLGRKLALISAPAGFGKTTLLSEWIAGCTEDLRIAWVSLDKGDNDLAQFLAYLVAAIQSSDPELGEGAWAMMQSPQPPAAETALTSLINDLAERPGPGKRMTSIVLVLDDCHEITADPIHDALVFLLDHLPPQMHVVMASRVDPPWPLARLRARREMTELRAGDLRFTSEETARFLNDAMGLGLSAEDMAALDRRTEGWIAGLQMAALSMRGRKDVESFIQAFSGSHRFILDYLMEEVLDAQSHTIQAFLLKTSILDRLTAPLCDVVMGWDVQTTRSEEQSSHTILTRLERANLFLVPLDDERRWYRYHRLFADLLRTRLEQTYPAEVTALHQRASGWCERAELIEEAVHYALAGQDLARVADLAEQAALQMLVLGKASILPEWLDALPAEMIQARPRLCVYHAWTQYWAGREVPEAFLRCAEQALDTVPSLGDQGEWVDAPPSAEQQLLAGHIAAVRAFHALAKRDIPRTLELAEVARQILPQRDYMRTLASIPLALSHMSRGEDIAVTERIYAEASAAAYESGHPFLAVTLYCYLGATQETRGRLHDAYKTYSKALEVARGPSGQDIPPAGFPYIGLGGLALEWYDLETAKTRIGRGIELCTRWGQAAVLLDAHIVLAALQQTLRDWPGVQETLQKAEQLALGLGQDPTKAQWRNDGRVRLWLAQGDLPSAVRWARTSALSADDTPSYVHRLHHIALARVLVAQGREDPSGPCLQDALKLLAKLQTAAERAGWTSEAIRIRILQALAYDGRGDVEGALGALSGVLALAEPGGYVRTFVSEGAPIYALLKEAAARGIAPAYVARLLAAFETDTESLEPTAKEALLPSPLFPSALVEPLSARELEVLRLLRTPLSQPEIADKLYVSVNTIRTHVKHIYQKLDVHSRIEAIERAEELGLI
ncbi:MAG TPA: LuxR C-terminal-related transcriptional regulator [Anaerolineae bacterium]|nr:LuxR C-terminal-related transcriptional regulator [Anaerolineae bacterium]